MTPEEVAAAVGCQPILRNAREPPGVWQVDAVAPNVNIVADFYDVHRPKMDIWVDDSSYIQVIYKNDKLRGKLLEHRMSELRIKIAQFLRSIGL